MQQYADIYLLNSHSTCFGRHSTHHQEYKSVTATSGTGHNTGTATSLQRGLYRRLRLQFLVLLMMGAVTPETCRATLQ